jgi:DNA-binding NtrC family response regulator
MVPQELYSLNDRQDRSRAESNETRNSMISSAEHPTKPQALPHREIVQASGRPSILVATTDPEIRDTMNNLLQSYTINTLWASGLEEMRAALAHEEMIACFCGFWLIDGTYRDVVSHLRRQRNEIPVIIVCAPACPQEYRDYLAALNVRAFDFICHPYRRIDLERILNSAMNLHKEPSQPSAAWVRSSEPRRVI